MRRARRFSAAALVLIGALTLLAGVGMRTWWLPPATISASVPAPSGSAPVTVIDRGVGGLGQGKDVTVSVRAAGAFVLARGRATDVEAWVGPAAHTTVSARGDGLAATTTAGETRVPSPDGADLFISSQRATGELTHTWTGADGVDSSLVLTADGSAAAPTDITVSWANDRGTPGAVPLLVLGAAALLLGAALLWFGRGGRRRGGRRGGSGEHVVLSTGLGTVLVSGMLVSGFLTAGSLPARAAEGSTGTGFADAGIALQPPQVDRIMGSVATVVGRADDARSGAALQPRMSGAALAERTANYRIRSRTPGYRAPAAIAAGPVLAQMITTGADWPRTVVIVTKDDAGTVPQILTLVQASPRENYRVVSAVGLLPGTTFPQAGSDQPGARPLDPAGGDGLTTSPRAALTSLASVLTAGRTAYTATVAKNRFVDAIIAGQTAAARTNPGARLTARHTSDPAGTRVLQTSDGGALVIGTLRNTVAVTPKEKGGRLTLRSELAALAGVKESGTPVDIGYGESVVLYVPAAGSREALQVIGAAQELLSVTRR
ncbi:hypothetical protein BKD30_09140 [Tersicoccus phoenicis]|uniref:DUF8094 domain-containing protein n=1 Tax=Tersicoccus phoenicis TaxID=554083 RepID=A0A1R1L968_9MICC|nr:hypothetical protein [Tersicoccus phoenicis]OMH24073.1 hypothetical protein BKD30_09140 [Tersicoccus phoenicis]